MFQKELNQLIATVITKHPEHVNLDHLEDNVWGKIHVIKQDKNLSWHEKILEAMSIWQFQAVTATFAMVFGLLVSIGASSGSYQTNNDKIGLQAFSKNSPYLLSTKLVMNHEETLR
jgi:hypothetical protein